MHILALEPWLGGSHARLLQQWQSVSRHDISVIGLPARHWKWRQAAGAYTLAQRSGDEAWGRPDALWVSDFVDVPQLRAFLPRAFDRIPILLYFHENQLTYPRSTSEAFDPDLGPAWSNLISALAADLVVFNSHSHKEQLRRATRTLLDRLPRPKPSERLLAVLENAHVVHPGIDWRGIPLGPSPAAKGPLRVLFPHRWEFDKDPALFLRLVCEAQSQGAEFELHLLGEYSETPPADCLPWLERLGSRIQIRRSVTDPAQYHAILGASDVVASTAQHETYGMAILEACAAGCTPLVPARLAYPETLVSEDLPWPPYATFEEALACLVRAAAHPETLRSAQHRGQMRNAVQREDYRSTLTAFDQLLEACCESGAG